MATEIISMTLTGAAAGITLRAGAGRGQDSVLRASRGTIVELGPGFVQAESKFDVFFEVDLRDGRFAYNREPLPLLAIIDCVPPRATYFHPLGISIPLYDWPTKRCTVSGKTCEIDSDCDCDCDSCDPETCDDGEVIANLLEARHDTFPPPPDFHASPPELSWVIFDPAGDVPGIPADFFGPGSDPFQGQVNLRGDPIDPERLGNTSTILQRLTDPVAPDDPAGTAGTVDIELVELSLVSTQPIIVTNNGGQDPEQWSVHVGLSETPGGLGSVTATKTHANGGTYNVTLHVQPLLTFTRVSDGVVMLLDTAAEGQGPYDLRGSGNFVHNVSTGLNIFYDPTAQWVAGIEETNPGDLSSQVAEVIPVEPPNGLRWLIHTIGPPKPPPPPDFHASPPGISWVRFDPAGDVPRIPADFFGPGSDPFEGQVDLQGDPIDPEGLGDTSTILKRLNDPVAPEDPAGAVGTVEIELVALSLRSTQPITVTFNGGQDPEEWNVRVDLVSPSPVSLPVGSLAATKTHANGGTYNVTLHVQPLLTFTRVSDGLVMPLNTAAEGQGPYELQGSGHFVHNVSPDLVVFFDPAAQWVGGIEETKPGDPSSQVGEVISVEPPNGLRWLVHGIGPPIPPPCPLPGDPATDPCAALQASDCQGSTTDECRPLQVQVNAAGTVSGLACSCITPGSNTCGPIDVTRDVLGLDNVSCSGACPEPTGPCVVFVDRNDGQGPSSTGQASSPATAFNAGDILTCDCESPRPAAPLAAPFPHDRRKNRYISFDPNKAENDGKSIAFKVELTAITLGSCNGAAGSPPQVDFCREDRSADDCNTCAGAPAENSCIDQAIDCVSGTCTPTGETCVNDAPNAGGTNVGTVWWVGPVQGGGHLLVSQSFRMESADWENPVHVGDCEIVPEAVYQVTAVAAANETESTGSVSIETTLFATASSSWWGDCVGPLKKFCGGDIRNPVCAIDGDCTAPETCDRAWTLPDGSVNFDDVNAALALVAPGPTSVAPDTTWVDLHGNATGTPGSQNFDPPNFVLNFSDIGQILSGFGGFPYKGYDPADCP